MGVTIGHKDAKSRIISIEVEDYQELKKIEDRISDLILCLDSTLETIMVFEEMYAHYREYHVERGEKKPAPIPLNTNDKIAHALRNKRKAVTNYRQKAKDLSKKVQSTRALVHPSFLDCYAYLMLTI